MSSYIIIDDSYDPYTAPDETPVEVRKVWSREWRSWGVYVVNAAGDQIGDAEWGVKADLPRMLANAERRVKA
jgi:hypothetical protein